MIIFYKKSYSFRSYQDKFNHKTHVPEINDTKFDIEVEGWTETLTEIEQVTAQKDELNVHHDFYILTWKNENIEGDEWDEYEYIYIDKEN